MILLAGLLGFAVVGYSTEYYMPGSFEPMMQVSRVDSDGLAFAFMGKHYQISAAPFETLARTLRPWRLFLPVAPQWSALLTERAYAQAESALARLRQTEDAEA